MPLLSGGVLPISGTGTPRFWACNSERSARPHQREMLDRRLEGTRRSRLFKTCCAAAPTSGLPAPPLSQSCCTHTATLVYRRAIKQLVSVTTSGVTLALDIRNDRQRLCLGFTQRRKLPLTELRGVVLQPATGSVLPVSKTLAHLSDIPRLAYRSACQAISEVVRSVGIEEPDAVNFRAISSK